MSDQNKFSITTDEKKGDWGKFIISPLPNGFGNTIGNSLRRTLLGSLSGAAVIQMKVGGASHIFATIKGVKEDLVEIALRVKQIRFSYQGKKPVIVKLEKRGPGEVKAGDLILQPGVEVANPDLVLANLSDKKTNFKMELTVAVGIGYESSEEHKSQKLGLIGLDSIFSPIEKVDYTVEATRKGEKIDFDKLTIEVWTDGSIKPKEAIGKAAQILSGAFSQIANPKAVKEKKDEEPKNHDLNLLIEEVEGVPLRLSNALKKAGYKKVENLIKAGSVKVVKAKNVGENSVILLKKVLKKRDIEFK